MIDKTTIDKLLTYLACAIWIGMLASIPYGIATGNGVPTGLCFLALVGLAPRMCAEADSEWDAHDAIEKAKRSRMG